MNPLVSRALNIQVLVMVLIATAAIALRWRAGELAVGDFRDRLLAPLLLVGIPLLFGGLIPLAQRQLASNDPRMADDHRRHVQGALIFWGLVMTAISGWLAFRYADPAAIPPGRETVLRGFIVLAGAAITVRANFFSKLTPPTPEPEGWTRRALNAGWILTGLGLIIVVSAIALPLRAVFVVLIAAAAALVWITVAQRRAQRP